MNGKKAKFLRRAAEAASVGQKKVDYAAVSPPVFEPVPDRTTIDGVFIKGEGFVKVRRGMPTKLSPACFRSHYKMMKKAIKMFGTSDHWIGENDLIKTSEQ